jgi:hypothetical protein
MTETYKDHDPCPVCDNTLMLIKQGDQVGVRCKTTTCTFNCQGEKCPECGGEVVQLKRPELGLYVAYCGEGHAWNLE